MEKETKEDELKCKINDTLTTMSELVEKITKEIEKSKKPDCRGKEELGNKFHSFGCG